MCSDPDDPTPSCEGSANIKTKVGNRVIAGKGRAGGNKRSGILSTPYGGPCVSVVCLPTSEPQQEIPTLPLIPFSPAVVLDPFSSCTEDACWMAQPQGWHLVNREYWDYQRVDWRTIGWDVANILTLGTATDVQLVVTVLGEGNSFANAQSNGDMSKAVATTAFDHSEFVKAIPGVSALYSGWDAVYTHYKGYYSMPTWEYGP
jgi:hypothetical protein